MRYLIFPLCFVFLMACQNATVDSVDDKDTYSLIGGKTMGTTYSAKFEGDNPTDVNAALDSLFLEINMAVSTYIDSALISKVNQSETYTFDNKNEKGILLRHFTNNFEASRNINKITDGYFDATVMPLVNYWGFGYDEKRKVEEVDKDKIAEILNYVGMDKIQMTNGPGVPKDEPLYAIVKQHPKVELDFSAIAKGYGADQAGALLEAMGIKNYLVEIGGEVVTKGVNDEGKPWVIGVNTPKEDAAINDFQAYVALSGKGMATSGNYRNYYEVNGQKFSHTINPKTGLPERSSLLSATIIANNCSTADAYATACMVGGLEKAMEWINNDNSLEGYFIFADKSGNLQYKSTEGFNQYLLD